MFLRAPDSWSNWNEMLVFEKRGKPENTEKNFPEQKEKTSNKLNIHVASAPREPRPHWWEATAVTTAPHLLLSCRCIDLLLYSPLS